MRKPHVVVTGIGVISACGLNFDEFGSSMRHGKLGIGEIQAFPTEAMQSRLAAEVFGFDPDKYFSGAEQLYIDRATQFALVAANEAMVRANLVSEERKSMRGAVIIGTGCAGANTNAEYSVQLLVEKQKQPNRLAVLKGMINAPAAHISMVLKIDGPSFVVSSACASSAQAIGLAARMIKAGEIDYAVCGGTEAFINFGYMKAWDGLGVMAPDACRPFSKGRKGTILGDGAAIFVLESFDGAKQRGASVFAEILGCSMSSNATTLLKPDIDSAKSVIARCLQDARIAPCDVQYINAHGTGTLANDIAEVEAIRGLFGQDADSVLVSSTKSIHGHALGASGALELAATIAGMCGDFAPPTLSFVEADPRCPIDCVPNESRAARIHIALSNSFAFGGHNAVLAIRR